MDQHLRGGFLVGGFEIEPLTGRIAGPAGETRVQPKVIDVLVFLAQHAGELVERETLLQQVWGRATSEEVLTRCISELRRAFHDERGAPAYIQTVPKRGYRLLKTVVPSTPSGAGDDRVSNAAADVTATVEALNPPSPATAVASVAVLPFDTHSPDPAYLFIGDAFAAELHSTLARADRLRVASRRSSFVFKNADLDVREIGAKLGVAYVISGSLQWNGSHLRVVAELSDTQLGTQLWAQSYDRETDDLLVVEKEVAEAVVSAFTTQQLRAETDRARYRSTSSLDAWGLVQKARSFVLDYTTEGLAQAIEPLQRAIELDRDYAAAHATLASLLVERLLNGLSTDPKKDESTAMEAAFKAHRLAPQDPFILKMVSLAWTYSCDYPRAISCLRKAVNYAPFDFGAWGYLGWPLTATGNAADLDDLRRILNRLLAADPLHPGVAFWLYHKSVADVCQGRFAAALEAAADSVALRPKMSLAWIHYSNVLGQLDLADRARQALQECRDVNPAMTPKHFASLVNRMWASDEIIEHRLGGLRKIGALG